NWTAFTGAVIDSGQGQRQIQIHFTTGFTASSGTLKVAAINNCGSSSNQSLTIKRNTPAAPGTPKLTSGPVKVCPGDICTYKVTAVAGLTYRWGAAFNGAKIDTGPLPYNTIK